MMKIAIPTNVNKGDKILIDCIPAGEIMEIDILDIGLSIEDASSKDLFSFRFKYKNQHYWHDSNCIINEFYREVKHIEVESFDNPIGSYYGDTVYERSVKYNNKLYRVFRGSYLKHSNGHRQFITFK